MSAPRYPLPEAFARTVTATFHGGAAWLASLPALLDETAARWSLSLGPPYELSYNYVAPAECADGTRCALKAGCPNPELRAEIEALRIYGGRGIVRLLEADPERGVFLLERIEPGTTLAELTRAGRDDEATSAAADVMRRLWRPLPPDHPFPTAETWFEGFGRMRAHFGGGTGPFPPALVGEAERLTAELFASAAPPVLLHGDLHHLNILRDNRTGEPGWLAIDPKGLAGEPAYEVGALLRNPPGLLNLPDAPRLTARRVAQLAEELNFDRARIRDWAVAQSLLSVWWTIEDNGTDWQADLAMTQMFADIRV